MQITCPHCGFSKQIASDQLPATATRGHCPRCRKSFPLDREETAGQSPEAGAAPDTAPPQLARDSVVEDPDSRPKAGFWVRLVAAVIDAFLVFWLQFGLGLLLVLAGITTGGRGEGAVSSLAMLVQLFSYAIGAAYYVVFTGHGGQTPGKMAVRVKVIRRDGQPVSYGRALFRELPCKFISAIILGIGYLMIAFDEQKQGLHDRMADTYVIKL